MPLGREECLAVTKIRRIDVEVEKPASLPFERTSMINHHSSSSPPPLLVSDHSLRSLAVCLRGNADSFTHVEWPLRTNHQDWRISVFWSAAIGRSHRFVFRFNGKPTSCLRFGLFSLHRPLRGYPEGIIGRRALLCKPHAQVTALVAEPALLGPFWSSRSSTPSLTERDSPRERIERERSGCVIAVKL